MTTPTALYEHGVDQLGKMVQQDYLQVMKDGMARHPRSLQKMIGPSEIGGECERRLLRKLAQVEEPERQPPWKPAVGTACHNQQEEWFGHESYGGRWLTEEKVYVGDIGGFPVVGSTDLFDTWTGGVIDHKFVGKSRLVIYRNHGPSQVYRCQAHIYGVGWAAAGYTVRYVMIAFVPRDGELSETTFWVEEFRPDVARWAMDRANYLWWQLQQNGLESALALYPQCQDKYCPWCQMERQQRLNLRPFEIEQPLAIES